ncbi:DUF3182 family protein [Janthinobacterium sp. 17J80-10]|uniref:DUF3182 family protein n=1 Tax=Janthinobacterium sp. 17J80-10 TaxID=2497863 RepID=UPI00100529FC|nr:DUF3182 family protein [Janthinobacterium sp. 17J80-10]QAU33471.1 DUF3182 family protein [Janthinobacterium sp. 17J80-10]
MDAHSSRVYTAARTVVLLSSGPHANPAGHEHVSRMCLASKLANLLACEFGGEFDPALNYDALPYFIPDDTLASLELAHRLGIRDTSNLFGGVVPYPFVATKTITHPLFTAEAQAPAGWSHAFGTQVRDVVLPGYSAFAPTDALQAATRLLGQGSVRMKKASGRGGCDQQVISDAALLDAALQTVDATEWRDSGVVFECNLNQAVTYSVGQVQVGSVLATYCGTQQTTIDSIGREVYGGSHLTVVRGGFDALLALDLGQAARTAVDQARVYHAAAMTAFPGMFASRCNYDIAQGVDDRGQWRSGVLEQSWRIGGASGAEIAALEAFQADLALDVVCASTTEIYQADPALPTGAMVYCRHVDPRVGPIVKYALLEKYAQPR